MADWKRPDSVPFPSIWRKFEGKNKVNGIVRQYWVQDITDDLKEKAIDLMCSEFVEDEALCKYSDVKSDPLTIEEFRNLWYHLSEKKLGLICFTKNENGDVEIAAVNMTGLSYENEVHSELKTEKAQRILSILQYINENCNVYKQFSIDSYLTALGLFVRRKFRGDGIGTEVLKSRRELCLAVGLKASLTLFTSNRSQAVARKAGFQDILDLTFEKLEEYNPMIVFPGIKEVSNSLKFMYIIYE